MAAATIGTEQHLLAAGEASALMLGALLTIAAASIAGALSARGQPDQPQPTSLSRADKPQPGRSSAQPAEPAAGWAQRPSGPGLSCPGTGRLRWGIVGVMNVRFPDATTVRTILTLASRAPSVHNTEPCGASARRPCTSTPMPAGNCPTRTRKAETSS